MMNNFLVIDQHHPSLLLFYKLYFSVKTTALNKNRTHNVPFEESILATKPRAWFNIERAVMNESKHF